MNNELQNQLTTILGDISATVTQAKDFSLEHLPEVASQYIAFGKVYWTLALFGSVVMVALCAMLCVQSIRSQSYDEFGRPLLAAILGVFGGVALCVSLYYAALVWFAPKIYLLDGIARLLK
jgi:hypothetical protein